MQIITFVTIYAVLSLMTFLSQNTRFSRHFWVCYQASITFNDVWWSCMLATCGTGVYKYVDNLSGCGTSSCFGDKWWKRQPGEIFLKSIVSILMWKSRWCDGGTWKEATFYSEYNWVQEESVDFWFEIYCVNVIVYLDCEFHMDKK